MISSAADKLQAKSFSREKCFSVTVMAAMKSNWPSRKVSTLKKESNDGAAGGFQITGSCLQPPSLSVTLRMHPEMGINKKLEGKKGLLPRWVRMCTG